MGDDSKKQDGINKTVLYGLYKNSGASPLEEEVTSMTPLLNSLKHPDNRYHPPELMAEGGEKRVFRVFDQRLNRYVAMAKAAHTTTPLEQEQFLREGQLTANLTHPNIVPIYNMGVDSEGDPFFSMELVPGDSLKDIIHKLKGGDAAYKAQYTLEVILSLFNKVCDAIAYAHSRNVLHLDIKPDNIRVGHFGEVLLCDWGLSRVESADDETGEPEPGQLDSDIINDMTLTGTMKGTPGFMASEQITGMKKTQQTDIYALGSVLYILLTHELPVNGNNAADVVENTKNGTIIPPRKRRAGQNISSGLAAVILKALALDPADRYPDVQQLQSDIHRFQAGYPTTAEHAHIFTRLALLTQRHRKPTLWLLTFFIILSGVIGANLLVIQKEKQEAVEARLEADRLNLKLAGVYESTSIYSDNLYPTHKLAMLDRVDLQALNPTDAQKILLRKAELQFVMQYFNKAHQTLKQVEGHVDVPALRKLAQKYGMLKSDDSSVLTHRQLAELFVEEIPTKIAYPMYHEHIFRKPAEDSPEAYLPLASSLLRHLNGFPHSIEPLKLTRRENGYYLDLSGTTYSIYRVPVFGNYSHQILAPLHLAGLDISHTPVSLLSQLGGLHLKELRMVGVKMENKYVLKENFTAMGLERVVLGKNDYSDTIIQSLKQAGIEVVEEEYER